VSGTAGPSKRPSAAIIQACSGAPELAEVAAELARRLKGMGIAASSVPPGAVVSVKDDRTVAVALDGCAAACSRRALEAQGMRTASIVLDELGGDEQTPVVDRIMSRLNVIDATSPPRSGRRRPRAPRPVSRPERAHSVGDYLRAIYALSSPVVDCGAVVHDAPALAAHVSQLLGVSRPTSGEMLRRLEDAGLVRRGVNREVLLTAAGRAMAERAVRRRRVLECFLVGFLGASPADAPREASLLEAAMDEEMVERIHERLGRPERCPHGWPLDPELERRESGRLTALSALRPDERATIVRLAEDDPDLLAWFFANGFVPGARAQMRAVEPDGRLAVRVDGDERTLGRAAASSVYVRRENGARHR